ncbi:MAG: hypothetical protein PUA95_02895 [Lactimicrobium massiliense]|nr:hypothetical protein [Lactimicrobium massiliense]MDD6229663.1 hypothetical protein [Lactimicrobium massiliense]
MSFEVRKLLKNRWLLVVAAVLMILSCTMYAQNIYITQQGNDYRTIREYYQNPSAFLSSNENMPAVVSTAESETVDRMQVQKNYAANVQELIQQNQLKLQLGIVKTKYDTAVIRKSISDFHRVMNLYVPVTFHGGIEKFCSSWYPYASAIIISLLCCFILFLQEEKEPVRLIIHAAVNGRKKLYHHKCTAVIFVSIGIFAVISALEFILSAILLGNGSLKDPVQALYGMWLYPYPIPIWVWLLLSCLMKCILLCTITFLFILLCNHLKKEWQLLLVIAMAVGISILTYSSSNLYMRSLNQIHVLQVQEWMSSNIYLNVFSVPVNRLWIILALSLFVQLIGWCSGFSNRKNHVILQKNKEYKHHLNRMKGSLSANEAKKYWLLEGGVLSLIVIAVLQGYFISSFHPRMTQAEMYYSKYAEVLAGEKTAEKDEYLTGEEAYLKSDTTGELYQRYLGFKMAVDQYQSLKDNEIFANRLSYRWFKSRTGMSTILLALFVMLAGLCYPASSAYGNEQETGMVILFQSTGNTSRIQKYRRISLLIHLGLLWLICFAPIYFKVGKIFGYYGLTIKAGIMPYGMFLALGIVAETAAGILFIRLLEKLAQKLKVRNYVLAVGLAVIFAGLLSSML